MPTQVPNSGYVEKVYFNTDLSENDIQSLIDTLPLYQTPFFNYPVYPLLFTSDFSSGVILTVSESETYGKAYMIAYMNTVESETKILYYRIIGSEIEYTPLTTKELSINKEIISEYEGEIIGTENEKLINLISITPFEEPIALKPFLEGIADAIREKKKTTELINAQDFRSEILSIKGGLIEVTELPEVGEEDVVYKLVKQGGTAVPNSGYVEKVYFNTSKDYESYYNLFEKLDYIDYLGSLVYPILFNPEVYMLYMKIHNNEDGVNYGIYYQNLTDGSHHPSAPIIVHDGNLEIWSPDFIERGSYVEVNNNVIDNLQGINIGLQNDLLTDFISIGQSFGSNTEEYYLYENGAWKQISGGFKTVDALPSVGNENYTYVVKAKSTFKLYSDITGAGLVDMEEFASQMGMAMELVAVVDSPDQLPTDNIKISNGETEMFFYYVRNYGLYVYGPFSGDGNSWMNTSSMMPFSGEITRLDEIIVKDTVYVLVSGGKDSYYIYDNKLKPVPNKGTISEIYFNTDLSVEEVVAELSKLTLDEDGIYVLGGSFETPCLLYITYDETAGWTIQDVFKSNIFFTSTYWDYINSAGWNHNLIKDGKYTFDEPIKLLTYNDDGDIVGSENWKITNVVRVFDNKWTKISGGGATVKATPIAVPNTGYVERIYLNKSLSFDEVNAICTKANNLVANELLKANVIACNKDVNKLLAVTKFTDTDDTNVNVIVYPSLATVIWSEKDYYHVETSGTITQWKKGWNIEENYLEFNDEVVAEANIFTDVTCGTYNDQLTDLFSANGTFVSEMKLDGEYDGTTITVSNMTLQGTEIPTTGTIGTVYCNTSMSVEEVVKVLKTLNYETDESNEFCSVVVTLDRLIRIIKTGNVYGILDGVMLVFVSESVASTNFVGWNPEYTTISVNQESTLEEGTVLQNDKLKNILSITPFEAKTVNNFNIDIKSMLEEKKLPLSINVNIESVNIVKSNGTAVPNSGYVEKIYFNTSKDFDSYYDLFEKLNLVSGYPILLTETGKLLMIRNTQDDFRYTLTYTYSVGGTIIESIVSYQTTGSENHKTIWNTNFISNGSCIEINENVIAYNPDFDNIGLKNDLLRGFVSTTPFENQVVKELSGDYEAVDIVVTENKTVDVETYLDNKQMPLSIKVNVESQEPNLQEKEITENGEYVADEGYDGFSKVTVNVAGDDPFIKIIEKKIETTFGFTYTFASIPQGVGLDYQKYLDLIETKYKESDVSDYVNYSYMFFSNYDLNGNITLIMQNPSSPINIFENCGNVEQVTIGLIYSKRLNSLSSFFRYAEKLKKVEFMSDILVVPNNIKNAFYNCLKLEEIVGAINMEKCTNTSSVTNVFNYCEALTNLTLLNIKVNLQISDGSSWGHLLTLDSLINTVKECINVGSARTLTMGTANLSKIASTYVKFTDSSLTTIPTNEKGDVVVCESTDTGAMLLKDYALLKNWTLA